MDNMNIVPYLFLVAFFFMMQTQKHTNIRHSHLVMIRVNANEKICEKIGFSTKNDYYNTYYIVQWDCVYKIVVLMYYMPECIERSTT